MAEPPVEGQSATDWTLEQSRALLRLAGDPESFKEVDKVTQIIAGLMNGTLWANREAARDELLAQLKETMKDVGNTVGGPLGTLMNTLYGVDYIGGSFGTIASGGGTAAARKSAGDSIVAAIFDIFNLPGVRSGYLNRMPGVEEQENFARFVGMNWQIQMADLIAEITAHWVPWDILKGVGEVGDKVQKILGLEDAQEEIMEPLMEKLIIEGLSKRFNRETMPTDLSPADAVQAHIQDLITPLAYKMILDNEGIRPDIRDVLVQLKAKNLTEADFRDLYQRGPWTQDDVFKAYRGNGYLAEDATLKTSLIVQDRTWQLRKELWNVKEQQFAHGLLDEAAFRAFLSTMHFSAEEEDIEIEIAKGKASMHAATKPKAIAGSFNVAPWRIKPGASAVMSWNIRNADSITISGIGSVEARGERVIQPDISQTYILTASNATDTEHFEAVVQVGDTKELKKPTASFSANPGRITSGTPVELKWSTNNADSVSIDNVGPVPESGALAVYPFLTTLYTLRASNAQGVRIVQDIVFVELPSLPDLEKLRPSVSFTITPLVFTKAQPRVEVKWITQRALGVTLEDNLGNTRDVGRNGVIIAEPGETGIWTLRASNVYGETVRQEAAIRKQPEEDTPPPPPDSVPPVLFLSVSPGTALPGENLFLSWNITGADVGTVVFADGSTRQVGASGNQSVTAPAVPGSYEFRLQAENAAGPASMSVIIVVSTQG